MLKNKKGQVSLTIMIMGFLLMSLLLGSSMYSTSMEIRNTNKLNQKQLTEMTSGGVYYAMSILKKQIDYDTTFPTLSPYRYEFMYNNDIASFENTVSIYQPGNKDYNTFLTKNFNKSGQFDDLIYLNYAQDVCFQITWDKDPNINAYNPVTIQIDKATKLPDNTLAYSPIKLPYSESDGNIGFDPKFCNVNMNNPAMIPADLMYDQNNDLLVNGYGAYRIKVTASGNVPNLQTTGLYNRLSYRTFEVKTTSTIKDKVKNNTRVIIQANYDQDLTNVIPKFKIIRWYEGDE